MAWPMVWPKLRIARRPPSRSSAVTTSTFTRTAAAMASATASRENARPASGSIGNSAAADSRLIKARKDHHRLKESGFEQARVEILLESFSERHHSNQR